MRFPANNGWSSRLIILCLCVILSGCTYPIKISNLDDFSPVPQRLDKRVKIGILSYNGPKENRMYFNMVVDALRRHFSVEAKQDIRIGESRGSFVPDYYISILPKASYEGDRNNFFTAFPGFLIFAPSWAGFKYSAKIHTTVEIFDRDGKKVDGIMLEPQYKFAHMDFERGFWTYTGWWIFYGAGALVSAPFMPRYDPDATPDFQKSVRNSYGDFVAESTIAKLKLVSPPVIADSPRPLIGKKQVWEKESFVQGQKWAVVVGISKYKYAGNNQITNLRYADRDAKAMAEFLKSPTGGGFDNVHLIINEDVTYKNLRYAFFDYLGRALEEDMVLVFFAGHGAPDPESPDNLYLLTYNTNPEKVSSTAFPMWDVETALKRSIKAETVIMLADACHSGGINPQIGSRGVTVKANETNQAILKFAHSPGRIFFTASEAREISFESRDWGGGHGAFTYYLLEGLKGKADTDGDQLISLGEMIDYTSEKVRRATRNKQHPDISGTFDRNMPIAGAR